MKTSKRGIDLIVEFEGLRTRAYPDPGTGGDPWTIGVGHTSAAGPPDVRRGMVITEAEALRILSVDLKKFESVVNGLVKVPLSQGQFDALASFTFNVGGGNLSSSTLLKKINRRDFEGAALEFRRWNKAAGRVLLGLTRRRAKEEAIFRN